MGRPPKERTNKTSFSVPANVLQSQGSKESVRKLNEEFKYKGGVVRFKSTTKGQSIKLSHPEEEYLENFRHRLLKELGLLEEEEGEQKTEVKKKENGAAPEEEKTGEAPGGEEKPADKEPPPAKKDEKPPEKPMEKAPPKPKSGDEKKVIDLIEEAVTRGAIDDGMIIKYAYTQETPERLIQLLRKILWSTKCRLVDKKCRFKRKQINFEETMKSCTGVREECEFCESDLLFLFPQWKQNVEDMFGEYKDQQVRVRGKISYAKHVERDDAHGNHFKFLIYDTFVNHGEDPEDTEPKETRKLWAKLPEEIFDKMNSKEKFNMEDIVDIEGVIVWNEFFYDYWIEDIRSMAVHEKKGDMPIKA